MLLERVLTTLEKSVLGVRSTGVGLVQHLVAGLAWRCKLVELLEAGLLLAALFA